MKFIEEIKIALEKCGYELVKHHDGKTLEYPKEIKIRNTTDIRVELIPHLFEAEDIKVCLKEFKVSEHNPEIFEEKDKKKDNGFYFLIVERNI